MSKLKDNVLSRGPGDPGSNVAGDTAKRGDVVTGKVARFTSGVRSDEMA
jgi:hypothetical protein